MMSLTTTLPRVRGFDFLIGDWAVHNRRLRHPLRGGSDWYEVGATATSRTLHNGAISVDEMWFEESGFAGCAFRAYDRADDTWSIYWVNSDSGTLQAPVTGRWSDGELLAEGPDEYAGVEILARFLWTAITPDTATWIQSFSIDGGNSWEENWMMEWTRTG